MTIPRNGTIVYGMCVAGTLMIGSGCSAVEPEQDGGFRLPPSPPVQFQTTERTWPGKASLSLYQEGSMSFALALSEGEEWLTFVLPLGDDASLFGRTWTLSYTERSPAEASALIGGQDFIFRDGSVTVTRGEDMALGVAGEASGSFVPLENDDETVWSVSGTFSGTFDISCFVVDPEHGPNAWNLDPDQTSDYCKEAIAQILGE